MTRTLFLLLLIFFVSKIVHAQNHMIHGIIHTLDSIPLIGAEVTVKSTNQTFYTDSVGQFVAACNSNDKLKVMANGFYNENIKISDKIRFLAVNLKMKPGKSQKLKSIGYGSVSNNQTSASVGSLTNKDTDFSKYNNIVDLIRDNFAGVQVTGGSLLIRGSKSLIGDSSPLIVIDGVIADIGILNSIHPIHVGSIHILKDGTTAVYGSRGTNGVVIVETLKGGEM